MSIAEMKLKAIEKILAINEEEDIKEVLSLLEKLCTTKEEFNADAFFNNVNEKYSDVMQKLAQ